jgi:hypothetical protein
VIGLAAVDSRAQVIAASVVIDSAPVLSSQVTNCGST